MHVCVCLCVCGGGCVHVRVVTQHFYGSYSLSGHRLPTTNIAFYPATKFAVRTLTEGIRVELREKKSKIRIAVSNS